jgi:hypothetical protein
MRSKNQQFRGDERDRTVGLLSAIQALSQLSYIPIAVVRVNPTAARILRSAILFATGWVALVDFLVTIS